MAIEAVIFDLDGTLAHFNLDYKTLRSEVRTYLMSAGVPASLLDVNESIFEMLKKAEIFVKNNSKSTEAFAEIRTKPCQLLRNTRWKLPQLQACKTGAVETLKDLQKMNLKMGLCTTSSEKAANYILQRFKIDGFFKVVVPRDKVKYVKAPY